MPPKKVKFKKGKRSEKNFKVANKTLFNMVIKLTLSFENWLLSRQN